MTLYAKLWCDIIGDEKLMRAARKGGKQLDKTPWLFAFAKKRNDNGRLSVGDEPAEPDDLAAGVPNVTPKMMAECTASLEAIGVLARDEDGVLRFTNWDRRNGWAPSDTKDEVGKRVAKHREKKRGERENETTDVTTPVTRRVTRRVTTPVTGDVTTVVTTARSREVELELERELELDKNSPPGGGANGVASAALAVPNNWVARLTEHIQREIGHAEHGRVGKALRSYVQREGESVVTTAVTYYAMDRRVANKSASFKWFLEDIAQWIDHAKEPLEINGNFTPLGKRLYGLNGAHA
jgi:hypothetical protein